MKSFEIIKSIIDTFGDEAIIVFANGRISTEGLHLRNASNHFYMLGSMGCASLIGLGMAISKKNKSIVIIDGDGNILMNPSSLITIGGLKPPNLLHLVIDNGAYETTGGQKTINHNWGLIDFATNCGYKLSKEIKTNNLLDMKTKLFNNEGPILGKLAADRGIMHGTPTFDKDPYDIKRDVQKYLNS